MCTMAITSSLSQKIRFDAVIAFFVLFACTFHLGNAIMCWECNSHYDKNCADPFRNSTFALTDCDMRDKEHLPNQKASVCRKIIQKVRDDYRFVRSCGYLESERETTDCFKRAGTFNVLVQYCSCKEDGCNGSLSMFGGGNWEIKMLFYTAVSLVSGVVVK